VKNFFSWLIHNYLFIRIPLFRPDRFLRTTWPWVRPLFELKALRLFRYLGFFGLLLAIQQWDQFLSTFLYFFSWQGLLFYISALILVKSAHELSHAYIAHKNGCRVASIGVAFLVLFPVLYTDVTDAWKLKNRSQKLSITLAGMAAELHIAMVATFLWAMLPDGVIRSAMFFLATTSWLTSLVMNVSPFMRFDGYFALSDLANMENLQPRAFSIARWKLREWIFGFGEMPPEGLSENKVRLLTLYAFATWLYRLILFIGIALLVYHFAFKLLGILLFLVEIIYFIAKPIYGELKEWYKRKENISWNKHTRVSFVIASFFIAWLLFPWKSTVSVPAVLEVDRYAQVYPVRSSRVDEVLVTKGSKVKKNDVLFELSDEDLNTEISQERRSLQLTEAQLLRLAGSQKDLEFRLVLEQKKQQQQQTIRSLVEADEKLTVLSPISGTVAFLENLSPGQYVNQDTLLAGIRSENDDVRVVGYVVEDDFGLINHDAKGLWIPTLIERPSFRLSLKRLDQTASSVLPYIELGSDYGGDIPTRPINSQSGSILRPEKAIYRIEFTAQDGAYLPVQREVGLIHVESGWHSPLYTFFDDILATAIKESGF